MSEEKPAVDPYPLGAYVTAAAQRNREPILNAFKTFFPDEGDVLELASGSGAHIAYFAAHFPAIRFQPSDRDETMFSAIQAISQAANSENVAGPVKIDLMDCATWPDGSRLYDVIFAINLFHVAPGAIVDNAARIAAKVLKPAGLVAIYGPFTIDGKYTTPSNEAFDRAIRAAKIPGWGLKDVRDLEKAAAQHGMAMKKRLDLPSNNFMLIFGKASPSHERGASRE